MYCHDLEVMSSNPRLVELTPDRLNLGVVVLLSYVVLKPKNIVLRVDFEILGSGTRFIYLDQVRLRTEVLRTLSSTGRGFELMTSRS